MASYADIAAYELRTGTDVPPEMEPTIQQRMDDVSALMALYMGDCEPDVVAAYLDILTALTVSYVYNRGSTPAGIKSESVGGTSVTYVDTAAEVGLPASVTDVLDELMEKACGSPSGAGVPGLGTVGATWGGRRVPSDTAWMRDVDVWVV